MQNLELKQNIDSVIRNLIGFLGHFFATVFLLFLTIPLWQATVTALVYLYLTEEERAAVTSSEILNVLNPFLVSQGETKVDISFWYFFVLFLLISWFFWGRKRRYAWMAGAALVFVCIISLLYYP